MKEYFLFIIATIGGFFTALFGEFEPMLQLLLLACVVDLISGILVAGVFQCSSKTSSGGLSSSAMSKGIARKTMIFLIVALGNLLDKALGTSVIQQGVIIAYIVNEILSLIENITLIGLPVPTIITKALDLLEKKGE